VKGGEKMVIANWKRKKANKQGKRIAGYMERAEKYIEKAYLQADIDPYWIDYADLDVKRRVDSVMNAISLLLTRIKGS